MLKGPWEPRGPWAEPGLYWVPLRRMEPPCYAQKRPSPPAADRGATDFSPGLQPRLVSKVWYTHRHPGGPLGLVPPADLRPRTQNCRDRITFIERDSTCPACSEGLIGSAADFYRFSAALQNGGVSSETGRRILTTASVIAMTSNQHGADMSFMRSAAAMGLKRSEFGLGVSVALCSARGTTLGKGEYG